MEPRSESRRARHRARRRRDREPCLHGLGPMRVRRALAARPPLRRARPRAHRSLPVAEARPGESGLARGRAAPGAPGPRSRWAGRRPLRTPASCSWGASIWRRPCAGGAREARRRRASVPRRRRRLPRSRVARSARHRASPRARRGRRRRSGGRGPLGSRPGAPPLPPARARARLRGSARANPRRPPRPRTRASR